MVKEVKIVKKVTIVKEVKRSDGSYDHGVSAVPMFVIVEATQLNV